MKRWLLAIAALAVVGAMASSALAAPGLNLAWGDCRNGSGTANKDFACNTNSGNNFLFGSFVAPAGVTQMSANEIVIDLTSASGTLPAWWEFKNTGTCRTSALAISFDGTTATGGCSDYWAGQASGGIGAYNIGPAGTVTIDNHARIVAVGAVPPSALGPRMPTRSTSPRIGVSNTKTTGTGSCAGCTDPVCIVLNSINVTQPVGLGDFRISDPANGNQVTWQGGAGANCAAC